MVLNQIFSLNSVKQTPMRDKILIEALEQIQKMKPLPGETDYKYAYNRCWHIATDALSEYAIEKAKEKNKGFVQSIENNNRKSPNAGDQNQNLK